MALGESIQLHQNRLLAILPHMNLGCPDAIPFPALCLAEQETI